MHPAPKQVTKLSETDAAELILDSYVMHIHEQHCQNCGCGERWSDLFEVWTHPTKTRTTSLHVLRPASSLQKLSIAYLSIPVKVVPVCSECIERLSLDHLPAPIPAASRAAWRDTLQRKYTPEPSRSESARTDSKPAPTLDML